MQSGILQDTDKSLLDEIIYGIKNPQKYLPSKLFYDEKGSKLFDRICELEEYYITRTEISIIEKNIDEITELINKNTLFIEFGSGSSLKTSIILENIDDTAGYIPIDISEEHLNNSVDKLRSDFPGLNIYPIAADFTNPIQFPDIFKNVSKRILFFPGSSIGNFTIEESKKFMEIAAFNCGSEGGLLIGVDMYKEKEILEAAYNDSKGVTAEFNLNILERINNEFGSDFNLDNFYHRAIFNEEKSRIEMYLVSTSDHTVKLDGTTVDFKANETILTEYSHKYTLENFKSIVNDYFEIDKIWTDQKKFFSLLYLKKKN
jgi:dimethylhistidine N-methyltransferase